jgi:hypothetical protein
MIALPGGFGTWEEIFEMVSHSRMRIHNKPLGVLNVNGFFQPMIDWIQLGLRDGFIDVESSKLLVISGIY